MSLPTDELHEAVIQDHVRRPRNHGLLTDPTHSGAAHNPFCGDTVRISLAVRLGRIERIGFEGRGCSISQAAASMLSELALGKTVDDVQKLTDRLGSALRSSEGTMSPDLGDLRALSGVRRFPNRIRCAMLACEAVREAGKDA
ncbi:MAG: SUF system NifU family Fe-S cluster assembly protein [Gemmatimonadota bacterium]|nr:SUF system NifU family Fe-S cluster assembly protein [Gemmatimonadota bacterium]